MLDSFLRHVTKDSYGPISFVDQASIPAVVHKFNDSFSVLNWGKMPETLTDRGRASAFVFSLLNQKFSSTDSWKAFLRSPEALAFRKAGASVSQGGSVSSMLNELVERLPIRSNFVGVMDETRFKNLDQKKPVTGATFISGSVEEQGLSPLPMLYPVCEYFAEEKIPHSMVMGRAVWDFSFWKNLKSPKMLPFEIHCHFVLNEESLKTLKVDSVSIPKTASVHTLQKGSKWDFPLIELVLPQDPNQRRVGLSEAIAMSGFTGDQLQETMLIASWIAAWSKYQIKGFSLESMRLRFAIDPQGKLILVDAFSLDDLHLEAEGSIFHAESALDFYQKTSWYENVVHAQKHSTAFGMNDWKRLCVEPAPWLDPKVKTKLENDYQQIIHRFSGRA